MLRSGADRAPAMVSGLAAILLLGFGYLAMTLLVALSPSRSTAVSTADPTVAAGAEVWRASGCISCHSIYGLGGHIGPDLTGAVSRLGADGVAARVAMGGDRMPSFTLPDEEMTRLLAWLAYLDKTGRYPLPAHFSPGYGDIR
jgi:nitric oxide reductase subunit C